MAAKKAERQMPMNDQMNDHQLQLEEDLADFAQSAVQSDTATPL
jgi:hypothetical protein